MRSRHKNLKIILIITFLFGCNSNKKSASKNLNEIHSEHIDKNTNKAPSTPTKKSKEKAQRKASKLNSICLYKQFNDSKKYPCCINQYYLDSFGYFNEDPFCLFDNLSDISYGYKAYIPAPPYSAKKININIDSKKRLKLHQNENIDYNDHIIPQPENDIENIIFYLSSFGGIIIIISVFLFFRYVHNRHSEYNIKLIDLEEEYNKLQFENLASKYANFRNRKKEKKNPQQPEKNYKKEFDERQDELHEQYKRNEQLYKLITPYLKAINYIKDFISYIVLGINIIFELVFKGISKINKKIDKMLGL